MKFKESYLPWFNYYAFYSNILIDTVWCNQCIYCIYKVVSKSLCFIHILEVYNCLVPCVLCRAKRYILLQYRSHCRNSIGNLPKCAICICIVCHFNFSSARLKLQYKHNIRTLSGRGSIVFLFLRLLQMNLIIVDNVRVLLKSRG